MAQTTSDSYLDKRDNVTFEPRSKVWFVQKIVRVGADVFLSSVLWSETCETYTIF